MVRLTRAQVREIDRRAIEEYHIPGILLMENAARAVAEEAWQMLSHMGPGTEVMVCCGGGNNGGDGLAVARHLHNREVTVNINFWADPEKLTGDARTNWEIIRAMNLPLIPYDLYEIDLFDVLVIDAIYGTGLKGPPRPPFEAWVKIAADLEVPILAVDLPSGLDCDTGEPLGPCIKATKTVTFVAEKAGFANPDSKQYTGEVIVADIGCPRELVEEVTRSLH